MPRLAFEGWVLEGAEVGPREGPVDFAVEGVAFEGAVRDGADVGPRDGPVDFGVAEFDRETPDPLMFERRPKTSCVCENPAGFMPTPIIRPARLISP